MTINGIKLRIRHLYIKLTGKIRRLLIKDKDFTIVSNNCWGGGNLRIV